MNDPLSCEVWDFFCTKLPGYELQNTDFSQIEWIVQIEELRTKLVRSTIFKCESEEIIVRIPLMTRMFELTIRKSSNFPEDAPEFSAEFFDGFADFEWNIDTKLVDVIEKFTDFCQTVDAAILEMKEADCDGFELEDVSIDEEEVGHLKVEMKAVKYRETLSLSVNIDDFQGFPRVLRCSNPMRVASFDCEKWLSDCRLGTNLRRLYGELEKENERSSEEEKVENQVVMMDFF